jgi:hypothetical protein
LTSKGEASGPTTRAVLVIVDGLALGVLAVRSGWLHGSWNTIANSGAVWLLGAVRGRYADGLPIGGRPWPALERSSAQ